MRLFMPLLILALLGACGRSAAPAVTPTASIARTPTPLISPTLAGNGGPYHFGLAPTKPPAATATRTTVRATGTATASRPPGTTPTSPAWGPPAAALAYGADSRPAQRASYSWTQDGRGVIADGAHMPWVMHALSAPAGATLILTVEQDVPLTGLFVQPTPLTARGYRVATPFAAQIPVQFSGSHAEIVVALPPGEYLLTVYARFPNGSTDYGFRVILSP